MALKKKTTVSFNIKHLRKKLGLTQEAFAEKVGVKRSLIGAYEESRAQPRPGVLNAMSVLFGVDGNKLLHTDLTEGSLAAQGITGETHLQGANPDGIILHSGTPLAFDANSQIRPDYHTSPKSQAAGTGGFAAPLPAAPLHTESSQSDFLSGKYLRTLSVTVNQYQQVLIDFISASVLSEYPLRCRDLHFLEPLPKFQLPFLPEGFFYRAFELLVAHDTKRTIVVARFVPNWFNVNAENTYVVVTQKDGVLCSRVINNISTKGILNLRLDESIGSRKNIIADEIIEIWEAVTFINSNPPQSEPSLMRLQQMILEMQSDKLKQNAKDNY